MNTKSWRNLPNLNFDSKSNLVPTSRNNWEEGKKMRQMFKKKVIRPIFGMCRASWKTPSKIFIRTTVENSSAMCEPVSQLWTTWIILGTSSITSQLNVNTHLYHHLYSISSSIYHHLYHHLSCHHRHHTTTGIYRCCVNGRVFQLMVNLLSNHIFHH